MGHRGSSRSPAVPCGPASGVGVGGRIGRTAFARQSPPRRVGPHRRRADSMGSDA
ncbi:hypothetical protein BSLA_01r3388 [Burkholderia stabilis]|nr:hypothetical protein BSLA_01r3388 [Burkholderia stabilis]